MADVAKYAPINGGTLITDLKANFVLTKTTKTAACAYAFVFLFIAFTIFIAFSPSSNSESPWFSNIYTSTFSTNTSFSDQTTRSHFSPLFSYLFPNSSTQGNQESPVVNNHTEKSGLDGKVGNFIQNQTTNSQPESHQVGGNSSSSGDVNASAPKGSPVVGKNEEKVNKGGILKGNQSDVTPTKSVVEGSDVSEKEGAEEIDKGGVLKGDQSDVASSKSVSEGSDVSGKEGVEEMVKALVGCNLYDGSWVKDESYPLYKPDSCLLIDEQFNCFRNGRADHGYYQMKWKPKGCTLPRLNATNMLELLRGKRLVYVGDSLNRNMWESLVCILRNSVKDKNKVYEENGRSHFKSEASYSFLFEDYNLRVEFFTSHFLVQQWEVSKTSGEKKETLRLDLVGKASDKYKNADFIIFNTGHWWTHDKTGKDFYQEGTHVYGHLDVLEAFRRAITTWARWVDSNINPSKTHVMFRGYSAAHFRGGQWNSGGQCSSETEPIKNETYLMPYPPKMTVLEKVLRNMKVHVSYLNVTKMSDYRKDGHPSLYRKHSAGDMQIQDCSHWCLPGVPDTWNELLYAELLRKKLQDGQH